MQQLTDDPVILMLIGMSGAGFAATIFILLQIRNQRRIWQQQQQLKEVEIAHQKDLLHTIIRSQETEQTRIGMDLHDEVGTILSTLRMTIDRSFTGPAAEQCMTTIDKVILDVRRISHDLSPFTGKAYRFIDALEDCCSQLPVTLEYECEDWFDSFSASVSLALYRVLSELINNTLRHANASLIRISFRISAGMMHIHYEDDGRGWQKDAQKAGMGMRNIESRLGMIDAFFEISSPAGKGFTMQIQLPMP